MSCLVSSSQTFNASQHDWQSSSIPTAAVRYAILPPRQYQNHNNGTLQIPDLRPSASRRFRAAAGDQQQAETRCRWPIQSLMQVELFCNRPLSTEHKTGHDIVKDLASPVPYAKSPPESGEYPFRRIRVTGQTAMKRLSCGFSFSDHLKRLPLRDDRTDMFLGQMTQHQRDLPLSRRIGWAFSG